MARDQDGAVIAIELKKESFITKATFELRLSMNMTTEQCSVLESQTRSRAQLTKVKSTPKARPPCAGSPVAGIKRSTRLLTSLPKEIKKSLREDRRTQIKVLSH